MISHYREKIKTEMLFKLSNLNSNLALTLGYLNPALNNLAQVAITAITDSQHICSHLCLDFTTNE